MRLLALVLLVVAPCLPAQRTDAPRTLFDLPLYRGPLPVAPRSTVADVFVQAPNDAIAFFAAMTAQQVPGELHI